MSRWTSITGALAIGTLVASCIAAEEPSDTQATPDESDGDALSEETMSSAQPLYVPPDGEWWPKWWFPPLIAWRQPGYRDLPLWPPGGGARCGASICGPGEYCCNTSCGICAPVGGACTQQICASPLSPYGDVPATPPVP